MSTDFIKQVLRADEIRDKKAQLLVEDILDDEPEVRPEEVRDKQVLIRVSEARRICRQCDVRKECLDYALSFPPSDLHGVWAGLTPRQLAAEASRRGVKASKFTLAQVWAHLNR